MSATRDEALAVFHRRYPLEIVKWEEITDALPANCYPIHPGSDCWFVLFSISELPACESSRLVAVSKRDGKIVYDDTANDEG